MRVRLVLASVLALASGAAAEPIAVDARISYDDALVRRVRAPRSGTVRRAFATRGDRVAAGARLFAIRYVAIVAPSRELDAARAALADARRYLDRIRVLCRACGGMCGHDDEAALALYLRARADHARARQRAGKASELAVTAPIAGEVLAVFAGAGDEAIAGDDVEQREPTDLAIVGSRARVLATARARCDGLARTGTAATFAPADRPTTHFTGTIVGTSPGGCAIAAIDNAGGVLDDGGDGTLVVESPPP